MNLARFGILRLTALRRPIGRLGLATVSIICCLIAHASAQAADEVKVESLIRGLNQPCGVTIRPGSSDLYVAESGAGRIIRVRPGEPNRAINVVTGFPQESFSAEPSYRLGPLGLAFFDKNHLIVGEGGRPRGSDTVRVFKLPEDDHALTVAEAVQTLGPIAKGPDSDSGEGDFYSVAVIQTSVYVASNGDDSKGWILKSDVTGTMLGALEPDIATKQHSTVDAPTALAMSRRSELVVGQTGELNQPRDSLLSFYRGKNRRLLLSAKTELFDITALAYSPKSELLYATDFAWMEPKAAGLYRLDMTLVGGVQGVKATRVVELDRPTAMVFASDGTLFVTTIGGGESDGGKTGQVLKISGEL
jgi:DNA-binding beta-propeller fold protein YncE